MKEWTFRHWWTVENQPQQKYENKAVLPRGQTASVQMLKKMKQCQNNPLQQKEKDHEEWETTPSVSKICILLRINRNGGDWKEIHPKSSMEKGTTPTTFSCDSNNLCHLIEMQALPETQSKRQPTSFPS